MNISLRLIENDDLEMLHRWMNEKHLFPFYMREPISIESVFKKFKLRIGGEHSIKCMCASIDNVPYGYAQWYLNRSYPNYGAAIIEKEFGFSIDYFIGEPSFLGKELGSQMLKLLIHQTFPILGKQDRIAYIGHDNPNQSAIRCTQKAGFIKDGVFVENGKNCTLYKAIESPPTQ